MKAAAYKQGNFVVALFGEDYYLGYVHTVKNPFVGEVVVAWIYDGNSKTTVSKVQRKDMIALLNGVPYDKNALPEEIPGDLAKALADVKTLHIKGK